MFLNIQGSSEGRFGGGGGWYILWGGMDFGYPYLASESLGGIIASDWVKDNRLNLLN